MVPLLDLDVFVYQAGYGAEKTQHLLMDDTGDSELIPMGTSKMQVNALLKKAQLLNPNIIITKKIIPLSLDYAIANIDNLINNILYELGTTEFKGFLSAANDPTNFRYAVAITKPYKGLRKAAARPVHYTALRNYLMAKYPIILCTGKEADDGLAQEQYKLNPESIIVSIDKDLLQVPGWHYNFRKGEYSFVTEFQGAYNLYTQVLTGDNADNIPGLPGVGPVTAVKILKDAKTIEELHNCVLKAYNKYSLQERFAEVLTLCKLLTD